MARTKQTHSRRQGMSASHWFYAQSFAGRSAVVKGGTYNPSAEPVPMGRCCEHRGLHVERDDCREFTQATSAEIAEDTFARF